MYAQKHTQVSLIKATPEISFRMVMLPQACCQLLPHDSFNSNCHYTRTAGKVQLILFASKKIF